MEGLPALRGEEGLLRFAEKKPERESLSMPNLVVVLRRCCVGVPPMHITGVARVFRPYVLTTLVSRTHSLRTVTLQLWKKAACEAGNREIYIFNHSPHSPNLSTMPAQATKLNSRTLPPRKAFGGSATPCLAWPRIVT